MCRLPAAWQNQAMRTGPYEFVKEMVEYMLDSDQPFAQAQTWAAVVSGIVIGYLVTWNW